MQKNYIMFGCLMAALAVVLGAFGAHALKVRLSPDQLATFETGVKYQFYHAFAILFAALLLDKHQHAFINYAIYAFSAGILCFSGSIYLLATRNLIGLTTYKWLGPITPIGGTFFIVAWILLFLAVLAQK